MTSESKEIVPQEVNDFYQLKKLQFTSGLERESFEDQFRRIRDQIIFFGMVTGFRLRERSLKSL